MKPRVALALAVATGGLAILLVALDAAWGLEAQVQERDGAGWSTVARTEDDLWTYGTSCARGADLRLVLRNDAPLARTVRYEVTWFDPDVSRDVEVVSGERRLGAFASAELPFTLPALAFRDRGPENSEMANFEVRADDLFMHLCAVEGTA